MPWKCCNTTLFREIRVRSAVIRIIRCGMAVVMIIRVQLMRDCITTCHRAKDHIMRICHLILWENTDRGMEWFRDSNIWPLLCLDTERMKCIICISVRHSKASSMRSIHRVLYMMTMWTVTRLLNWNPVRVSVSDHASNCMLLSVDTLRRGSCHDARSRVTKCQTKQFSVWMQWVFQLKAGGDFESMILVNFTRFSAFWSFQSCSLLVVSASVLGGCCGITSCFPLRPGF